MKLRHHPRPAAYNGRSAGQESGFVLVLGSVLMVSLLLFTSIVVDLGAVYSERRRDQSAADVGALAAAQNLEVSATATAKAISYAEDTLGTTLAATAWNGCTVDAGALSRRATGKNCISFNATGSRIRVRIPDRYYQTAFARVVGIKNIRHSAFAIAGVSQRGFGGVLPFGMPSGAGGSEGYACLKSNAGGQSQAPCNGPDSGNFGTIDITQFGSEDKGTTQSCGSGDSRTLRVPNNIAVGSDHELGIYAGIESIDSTACLTVSPLPNAAITEAGNLSDAVESGLLTGTRFSDGGPARFQRSDPYLLGGAGRKRSVRGALVDDNGLWSFIPASLTSTGGAGGNVPESCQRNQFVDGTGTPTMDNLPTDIKTHVQGMALKDRMLSLLTRCFSHYSGTAWGGGASAGQPALTPAEPRVGCGVGSTPCTDPVFGLNVTSTDSPDLFDLQYTPRFAYVPELTAAFPSGASTAVRFKGFRAVFIQRITLGTGTSPTNFDPGIGTTAVNPSGNGIREVTMWVFPQNMLPGRLQETNAAYAIGVNRFAQLVR